jgi:phospho-N-acetylmuramoyl-pentapeptide-transferase
MSVVIQVLSYRPAAGASSGMTPLHHHFELVGWAEEKITLRFWIVAALAGLLGFSVFLGRERF